MSIKEIKERWDYPNADKLDWNNAKDDIDRLLSLLEKEEAQLTIKILENAKGTQVLSELEEKVKELESETSYMESLTRAKMEAESEWAKAEEKVKKLEGLEKGLRNAIECDRQTIVRWEELFKNVEAHLQKLEAELKKYKEKDDDYSET